MLGGNTVGAQSIAGGPDALDGTTFTFKTGVTFTGAATRVLVTPSIDPALVTFVEYAGQNNAVDYASLSGS